jgi:hypothetical protein
VLQVPVSLDADGNKGQVYVEHPHCLRLNSSQQKSQNKRFRTRAAVVVSRWMYCDTGVQAWLLLTAACATIHLAMYFLRV